VAAEASASREFRLGQSGVERGHGQLEAIPRPRRSVDRGEGHPVAEHPQRTRHVDRPAAPGRGIEDNGRQRDGQQRQQRDRTEQEAQAQSQGLAHRGGNCIDEAHAAILAQGAPRCAAGGQLAQRGATLPRFFRARPARLTWIKGRGRKPLIRMIVPFCAEQHRLPIKR